MTTRSQFDEIGYWSEVKLDIVRDYASAYSTILSNQPSLHHSYIDGFAGSGVHVSRTTGGLVLGSPINALSVTPPFRKHYLIDLDGDKVEGLRELVSDRRDVTVLHGDCNEVLIRDVFPNVRYEDYRRGLCLLDPYGLDLRWSVIETAGRMRSLDLFLNFPIMDMNRNVLWNASDQVDEDRSRRMTAFWGDDSWRSAAYRREKTLFETVEVKNDNEAVTEAFRERLKKVGGFQRVPPPLPMKNTKGAVVYYLFFASQKDVAEKIVVDIFNKYRTRRS